MGLCRAATLRLSSPVCRVAVKDLGSGNGTYIKVGKPMLLMHGDRCMWVGRCCSSPTSPDVVSGLGHRGENEPGTSTGRSRRKAGGRRSCARGRSRASPGPEGEAGGGSGGRQARGRQARGRARGAGCSSRRGRSGGRSHGDVRGPEAAGAMPERPDHLRGGRTCRHQDRCRLSRRGVRHGSGESDFRRRASGPVELHGAGHTRGSCAARARAATGWPAWRA